MILKGRRYLIRLYSLRIKVVVVVAYVFVAYVVVVVVVFVVKWECDQPTGLNLLKLWDHSKERMKFRFILYSMTILGFKCKCEIDTVNYHHVNVHQEPYF